MIGARHLEWWQTLPRRLVWLAQGDWWVTRLGQWVCERTAHAPGVVWYNVGGDEPDMRCKRCGKDIG